MKHNNSFVKSQLESLQNSLISLVGLENIHLTDGLMTPSPVLQLYKRDVAKIIETRHEDYLGVWTGARNRRDGMSLKKNIDADLEAKRLVDEVHGKIQREAKEAKTASDRNAVFPNFLQIVSELPEAPGIKCFNEGRSISVIILDDKKKSFHNNILKCTLTVRFNGAELIAYYDDKTLIGQDNIIKAIVAIKQAISEATLKISLSI